MIPTHIIPYRDGELRIGWASWDDGDFKNRSIKYAYPDKSGKISRGAPELPFDVLIDMLFLAYNQGELDSAFGDLPAQDDPIKMTPSELTSEHKRLATALVTVMKLVHDIPWIKWNSIYDAIGLRLDQVKEELGRRHQTKQSFSG